MARLYPFRALRYNPARVNMEAVVTQPYDKITPAMQQRYYEASPYNLVRVILGKQEPGDTEPQEFLPPGEKAHNCYTRANEYLHDWRKEGILVEETVPAVYGYSQTYTVPGSSEVRERRGFIALGHLYDYADKVVYRHEQTFPKHKSDRLALFKATRTYCEQIYMLYSDPAFTAEKLIFGDSPADAKFYGDEKLDRNGKGTKADQTITDEYGVVHRLWKLTDPNLINCLLTAMRDKKLIIADGHHRYETSVAYAKERSAQLKLPLTQTALEGDEPLNTHLPQPPFPEAAMMMTFVNMDAPGITILPTHRVVSGIENFSSPDFITKASNYYTITELDDEADTPTLLDTLTHSPGDSFLAVTGDGNYILTPKHEAIAPLLKDLPAKQGQLGVAQLHAVVLNHILGLTDDKIRALGHIQYLREASEAVSLVHSGEANIAFLIKPVTLDQLKDVSLSNEVMPQKSTDFYPKLLSGLAIYALD